MAKTSQINRNKMRERLSARDKIKRAALQSVVMDRTLPVEVRVRLRCELTGRARANYRKFKLSRIALRDLASSGQIPGMVKASW